MKVKREDVSTRVQQKPAHPAPNEPKRMLLGGLFHALHSMPEVVADNFPGEGVWDVQLSEQFPQIRWQNIDIKESPLPCMIYDCSRYATMTCIAHNGRDYSKLTHFEVKICDECREAYLMQYLGMGQGEEDEDPFWSLVDRNEKCFVF